jgi:hypothetical protein
LLDHGDFETAGAGSTPARMGHFLNQRLFVAVGRREDAMVLGD